MTSAVIGERLVQDVIRALVRSWQALPAEALAPVRYDHNSAGWVEYWQDVMLDIGDVADLAEANERLMAEVLVKETFGIAPTPEMMAAWWVMLYGREEALPKYVEPFVAELQAPDQHVTWLLMHPETIPANFPMWRRPL